jgi:membrane protein DedA with SNARE-associated domain/rhodanese-related sulfurtransferase
VFVSVLVDQGGLPTPAYPQMIVTAAVAVQEQQSLVAILLVATFAALLADALWYSCGKRFGTAMLRLMCRVSLSPDSCVGTTRRIYSRWGASSLIFAKYVPGLAAVATTLAGETRTSVKKFLFYDSIGALLWAGGAVILGALFHDAVGAVLLALEELGYYALVLLAGALALFIAFKWQQRRRFTMQIRMARMTPAQLAALIEAHAPVIILDVRSSQQRAHAGWIPGSVHVEDIEGLQIDPHAEVIVYCDCPNDASAAVTAKRLKQKGYTHVRPLAGGMSAWRSAGQPVLVNGGRRTADGEDQAD